MDFPHTNAIRTAIAEKVVLESVMMRRTILVTVIACMMAGESITSAKLIQGISIDFVTIGNPGNPGDTRPEAKPSGCGSVDYIYQIGKYEVTNAQWYDFVAAAGAPTGNPSSAYDKPPYLTGDDLPAHNVSWYEAAQFCNYLTSGYKCYGAYSFSGDPANPDDFQGITRDWAVSTYGVVYVLPTEDEWYKAAYYTGNGYSTYANGTDAAPIAGDDTNYDNVIGQPWDVGVGNGTQEQNGTFDMMGNVIEWNETVKDAHNQTRGQRGGTYSDFDKFISSSFQQSAFPEYEYRHMGFRIVSIPEPATLLLLGVGGLAMLRKRRQA